MKLTQDGARYTVTISLGEAKRIHRDYWGQTVSPHSLRRLNREFRRVPPTHPYTFVYTAQGYNSVSHVPRQGTIPYRTTITGALLSWIGKTVVSDHIRLRASGKWQTYYRGVVIRVVSTKTRGK